MRRAQLLNLRTIGKPKAVRYSHSMVKHFTLEFFQKTGRQGGKAKTKAKAAAARENGKNGGRPRKKKGGE